MQVMTSKTKMQHVAGCQKYLPEASIFKLEYGKSLSLITCSSVGALLLAAHSKSGAQHNTRDMQGTAYASASAFSR